MVKVVVFNQQKHDLGNFLTDPCKTLALEWRGKKKKRKIGGQDQVFIFLWRLRAQANAGTAMERSVRFPTESNGI